MPEPAPDAGGHVEVLGLASLRRDAGRLLIAVGVFDGLHRGHAYLLRRLRREAVRLAARPAVITFDAHPDEVLLGKAPPILCDPDERLVRLARAGVAVTIVQHFDEPLRRTGYEAFVEMIRDRTPVAGFLMTPDAAFGYERRGTPGALAELGRRDGFAVIVVPPLELDGRQVRSTEIRARIAAGDLRAARLLLGRSIAVVGEPRPGSGGRLVGFALPAALPPPGTYRVTIEPAWGSSGAPGRGASEAFRRRATADVVGSPDGALVELRTRRALPPVPRVRIAFASVAASSEA